jgi:hypothetical protein
MSTFSDLRSRALPHGPSRAAVAPEVRLLLRFVGVLLFVVSAVSVHLFTRLQVQETALRLDGARSDLVRAQTHHDRLFVERTMLRSPGRLGAIAVAEDLTAPERVVDLVAEAP